MKALLSVSAIFIALISYQNCTQANFAGQTTTVQSGPSIDNQGANLAVGRCYGYANDGGSSLCGNSLNQTLVTTLLDANGNYQIRVNFPKEFVDNTYGANAIGWEAGGHKFNDLVGSDHLQLLLKDKAGATILEVKLDYISEDKANKGTYITGVEKVDFGDINNVIEVKTSLVENFNSQGYILETDSPVTDSVYTPNVNYPNWDFNVWYQITVKADAFAAGGGIADPIITSIHASPSKIGENTCSVVPEPCTDLPDAICEDNPDDPDDDGKCDGIIEPGSL